MDLFDLKPWQLTLVKMISKLNRGQVRKNYMKGDMLGFPFPYDFGSHYMDKEGTIDREGSIMEGLKQDLGW